MHSRKLLSCCSFMLLVAAYLPAQTKTVAERLGYPADSKLLIVHADDLAVAHSVDSASFDALDKNAVTSASIMVPCPWITEVAAYAKAHPDADLGLHLTLTSEWTSYRWGPVASSDQVTSLLDPAGTFWSETEKIATNAKPQEAEREIRAQIDRAIALGIHPTHLDSHMGSLFSTPELFATFAKVAHDYHLPFLAVKVTDERARLLSLLSEKDIVLDALVMAGDGLHREQWKQFYLNALKDLKPGLTEMIVHLGHDDAELQAVTVDHPDYGSAWRQRDYDLVTSPEFKKAIHDNHIILVKWKDLQEQLQAMPRRLEKLRKSGMKKLSRTDADARFLRERSGFALGYTAEAAVNEDHLIVGQRVTQNAADNNSLIPMVDEAERQSGTKAEKILADAGFFSLENIMELDRRGLDVSGFEPGAGVEHGTAVSENPAQPDAAAHAAETARADRPISLSPTQGFSRTGLGNAERTKRDEAVSVAGTGKSKHRVHPGGNLIQPDPAPGQPPAWADKRKKRLRESRSHAVSSAPGGDKRGTGCS